MKKNERKQNLSLQLTLPSVGIIKEITNAFCTVLYFNDWDVESRGADRSRVISPLLTSRLIGLVKLIKN